MPKYFQMNNQSVKLDEKDKKILQMLNDNCRLPLTTISRKTGIPIDTVKYRIERMEKEQVFSYATIINPPNMGFPIFNGVYLQLIHFSKEEETKLTSYIKQHPNLVYSATCTGQYDYIIGIVAKDLVQFNELLHELKSQFTDIIKDYMVLSIIEEHKYDYLMDLI